MFITNEPNPSRVLKCHHLLYLQNANKVLTLVILLCQLKTGGSNNTMGIINSWLK